MVAIININIDANFNFHEILTRTVYSEKLLFMRLFLSALILIFSFQSLTKAEDIRDFEIEGMSIGDSLLDYFSKKVIIDKTLNYYKDKTILPIYIEKEAEFNEYDGVQFHINMQFKILSIEGVIWFKDNFEGCKKKQKEIDNDFKSIFSSNISRWESGINSHEADKSGKSIYNIIYYDFKSKDTISIGCYDWSKEMKHSDNLRVGIITNELMTWINTNYE